MKRRLIDLVHYVILFLLIYSVFSDSLLIRLIPIVTWVLQLLFKGDCPLTLIAWKANPKDKRIFMQQALPFLSEKIAALIAYVGLRLIVISSLLFIYSQYF